MSNQGHEFTKDEQRRGGENSHKDDNQHNANKKQSGDNNSGHTLTQEDRKKGGQQSHKNDNHDSKTEK